MKADAPIPRPGPNWSRVLSHSLGYVVLSLGCVVIYLLLAALLNAIFNLGLPTSQPVFLALVAVFVLVVLGAQQTQKARARSYEQLSLALSEAMAASITEVQLIHRVLGPLAEFLGVKRAVAFLYRHDSSSFVGIGAVGLSSQTATAVRFDATNQIARWLQDTRVVLNLSGQRGQDYPADLSKEEMARLKALNVDLLIAMRVKGKLLGWLAFGPASAVAIGPERGLVLVQSLAERLGMAVSNAQLESRANQRREEMSALIEIAKKATSSLELDHVLSFLAERVGTLLQADGVLLYLTDPTDDRREEAATPTLSLREAWGMAGLDPTTVGPIRFGQGIAGAVAHTVRPILTREASGDPRFWQEPEPIRAWAPRSLVSVPLYTRERVVGVLTAVTRQGGRLFDDSNLQLLSFLSDHAAIAIDNAQRYTTTDQALAATVAELSTMQEVDRQLNATLDFEKVLDVTLDWALRVTKSDLGLIGALNQERGRANVWVSRGMGDTPAGRSLDVRFAVVDEAGTLIPDLDQHPERERLAPGSRSQLSVPIHRHERMLAFVTLESETPDHFSADDLHFLRRLAEHAAIAIENSRLYDDLKRANEAKSEFVSIVSHELKIPMTSIKGYAQLISLGTAGELQPVQRDFLGVINRNVDRMDHLVSSLLDLSRLDAGRVSLNLQPVAVSAVVDDAVSQLRDVIAAKRLQVNIDVPPDLPPMYADPARIGQVVTNLLSNACKYTPDEGTITLRARRLPLESTAAGEMLAVDVADTGIGIAEEDKPRIFTQFFRADHPGVQATTGTGLGLSLTKRLVELHGGEITFASELDHGATFTFTAPVATPTDHPTQPSPPDET